MKVTKNKEDKTQMLVEGHVSFAEGGRYKVEYPKTDSKGKQIWDETDVTKEELVSQMQKAMQSKSGDNPFADAERITWSKAKEIWEAAVPGSDDVKEKAVQKLAQEWMARFRATKPEPQHTIPLEDFLNLAREVIIGVLTQASGLQLKVERSRDGESVFCRVRAPLAALERQADLMGYRLQFKREIDPGTSFWLGGGSNTKAAADQVFEEIEEENRLLEKDEASQTLEQLYNAGHVEPSELAVFEEETKRQWSTRVHALERVADGVPCDPEALPAYAPFEADPKLRHLFATHDTSRGRTLFQTKDRLVLTKAILDSHFDVGVLVDRSVLKGVMALHDASSGDQINRKVLLKRWSRMSENLKMVGAPCVSHAAMDHANPTPWYLVPFAQPLHDIRDYFGERLALFFAWLGFYAYWLLVPAAAGLAYGAYAVAAGDPGESEGVNYYQVAFVTVVILWTVLYKTHWDQESALIAVAWGTHGFEEEEADRPQFRGWPEEPRRRSEVTNRLETYYPEDQRARTQVGSVIMMLTMIAACLAVMFVLFYLEYELESMGYDWGSWLVGVLFTCEIQFFNRYYKGIARNLNDLENYQTQTEFEDMLIFKTFFFQIFNNYAALTFAAFFKEMVFGCVSDYCLGEVRELLIIIFAGRFASLGLTVLEASSFQYRQKAAEAAMLVRVSLDPAEAQAGRAPQLEPFEQETLLERYDGEFDGYAKACIQYGYVVMFALALPFAPLLALLENLVELRLKAFQLTRAYQRPDPAPAEDVGLWGAVLDFMSLLAVLTNTGLFVFSGNTFAEYDLEVRWLYFLLIEHAALAVVFILHQSIPSIPEELEDTIARQSYVVDKHKGLGGGGGSGGGAESAASRGHIEISAAAAGTLEKKGKGGGRDGPSKGESKRIRKLNQRLEILQNDIRIAKRNLKSVMKTEVYNELTGVGETKHGLSLGVLTIKLILAEKVDAKPDETTVVISIKPTKAVSRGGLAEPGPPPQASKPARRGAEPRTLDFNQVFTMAPIRTQDAEVTFDIMDKSAKPKRKGSCRILLRELANQQEHEKYLNVQVRGPDGHFQTIPEALLFVRCQFTYSKVVPLKANIFTLQDKKRQIEKEITLRRLGQLGDDEEMEAV